MSFLRARAEKMNSQTAPKYEEKKTIFQQKILVFAVDRCHDILKLSLSLLACLLAFIGLHKLPSLYEIKLPENERKRGSFCSFQPHEEEKLQNALRFIALHSYRNDSTYSHPKTPPVSKLGTPHVNAMLPLRSNYFKSSLLIKPINNDFISEIPTDADRA